MICKNCGKELPDNSTFCPACGQRTGEYVCRRCGHANSDGAMYCSSCGEKLSGKRPVRRASGGRPFPVVMTVIAVLLLVFGAGAVWFNMAQAERLTEAQTQLTELTRENEELQTELDAEQQIRKTAEKEKTTLEKRYKKITSFAADNEPNAFRQYNDLYSYSNAVVVRVGETADFSIVWANAGTISWECDNLSVVYPAWGDSWQGSSITLGVTGRRVGSAVITVSNSFNDHSLEFLVIVTE